MGFSGASKYITWQAKTLRFLLQGTTLKGYDGSAVSDCTLCSRNA
jgi:hypothetical protein